MFYTQHNSYNENILEDGFMNKLCKSKDKPVISN